MLLPALLLQASGRTFSLVCMKINVNGGVRTHVSACPRACGRACVMCLQYLIGIIDPG